MEPGNEAQYESPSKPKLVADNPRASLLWDYYQGKLRERNKWQDEYAAYFTVLINAIVDFLDVSEKLASEDNPPLLFNPRKGTTYRNPLLDIKAQAVNVIQRFGSAFGLNPLADAKIKSADAGGIGELLKMMQVPG